MVEPLDSFVNMSSSSDKRSTESTLVSSRCRVSPLLREASRCGRERDEERLVKLEAIRQAVAVGVAQVDEGQGVPGPPAFARIRSSLRQAER
jgi:hypothetical protein